MRIFAIADLHLSGVQNKNMDIFGATWENHAEHIRNNWMSSVAEDDVVLIPGDISWALHLEDAIPDLEWIGRLPGRKVLVRGNHDYWWSSPSKIKRILPDRMSIIQNNAIRIGDFVICGTRGWIYPAGSQLRKEDQKIHDREIIRLRMSLEAARNEGGEQLIVMMHYPPLGERFTRTAFTDILEEYKPSYVVFGHLHGRILEQTQLESFEQNGIEYKLVSADYAGFKPVLLTTVPHNLT